MIQGLIILATEAINFQNPSWIPEQMPFASQVSIISGADWTVRT